MLLLSQIFLFLLPLQFALTGWGWDVPLARLLAAAILLLFLIECARSRRMNLPPIFFTAALLSFLFLASVSVLWSAEPSFAWRKLLFLWNIIPLLFVWWHFSREGQIDRLIRPLLIGAGLTAIFALVIFISQFYFGVSEVFHLLIDQLLPFFLGPDLGAAVARYPSLLVNIEGATVLRATAFFPDPHVAAYFFGMTGFLSLGYFLATRNRSYIFLALLLFTMDLLTFSRGGYAGMLAGAAVMVFFVRQSISSAMWKKLLWSLLVSILILGLFGQGIVERFTSSFSLGDASNAGRLVLWREAATLIQEHPVFGTGLGNAIVQARPLADFWTPYYAHNVYLDVAVELGSIGLLAFLLLLFLPLSVAWQRAQQGDSLALGLVGALTLYLIHSLFETALFSIHVASLLGLFLILSLARPIGTSAVQ